MRKVLSIFLVFSVCGSALADTIGFRAGLSVDSPDVRAEEKDLYLTPMLEFDQSFGNIDLYADAEYSFHLTKFFPQFFTGEEKITAHLPFGSHWELQLRVDNENTLFVDPDQGSEWTSGRVSPGVGTALFFPAGDFSLDADFPITYRTENGGDIRTGIDLTAAYVSPFWIGIRVAANFIRTPHSAFDGMEYALTFEQDQFYSELAFKASESFDYFSLRAQFDYFFNFWILNIGLEAGNLGVWDAVTLAAAVGIKYRF
jgi:hypothetical protein